MPKVVDDGIVVSRNPSDLPTMRNDEILMAAINVCTETHFFEQNLFFTEKESTNKINDEDINDILNSLEEYDDNDSNYYSSNYL